MATDSPASLISWAIVSASPQDRAERSVVVAPVAALEHLEERVGVVLGDEDDCGFWHALQPIHVSNPRSVRAFSTAWPCPSLLK